MFGNKHYKIVSPIKLGQYLKKHPVLFPLFYQIFIVFTPLFLFIQNTTIIFHLLYGIARKEYVLFPNDIILLTDKTIIKTNERLHLFDSYCVILPPFSKKRKVEKYNTIHSLSFLTCRILFSSYFLSLLSPFFIVSKYNFKNILYSMNSFEWFILFQILEENITEESDIILSNQKDRWALLVDSLSKGKRSIVQHGTNIIKEKNRDIEIFLIPILKYNSWAFNIPIKYNNINKLYAFNKIEADHVVLGEFNINPKVEYIGYNLSIEKHIKLRPLILLIGNIDVYYDIEKFIISNLNNNDSDIVIKPHPLSKREDYDFINDSITILDYNPDPDIIISYQSTLAYEYESLGYRVYYYYDIASAELVVNILNERK